MRKLFATQCANDSAVIRPDGTLLTYQRYGNEGLLFADIDIATATGILATRYSPIN